MGISGLLQFIKDASEPVNVKKYRGRTVAVDTYCWLHKGAFSCAEKLAKGEPTDQYVWYCMKLVEMMLNFGVKPVLVFDGRNLPSKKEVEKSRRERREVNLQKGRQLLREGKVSEARECFNRCVNITPAMAHNLIKAARARGVDCLVAPYEADAQLAFLSKSGLVDAVITEDSDLLAFGCSKVILKMDKQGNALEIDQRNLGRVKSLGNVFTEEKFRQMCILSGCDYLPSLHGIGLGKACKLLRLAKDPDILKVIRKMGQYLKMDLVVPDSYLEGFVRANNTFLYQLVFDPRSRRVLPLNPYPENICPQELSYAGLNLGDEKGLQMALGNLDLNSLETIDDFSPDAPQTQKSKPRSRSWNDSPSALRCGPSIWSRGHSAAPPAAPSSPSSPSAEHRASTRGQHRVVSVAALRLPCKDQPCRDQPLKRQREDSPLSEQDMLLQYSSSDQKRPRPDPRSSSPRATALAPVPVRGRNRFATLLQRRNQEPQEDGAGTCSRFFSSSQITAAPLRRPSSEAESSEGPEAPSVETPSPSPPASPLDTAENTTTTTTSTASPQNTPAPASPPRPAAPPGGSSRGQQLFRWSTSAESDGAPSSGLSALKRFRFQKENVQTPSRPQRAAQEQPDSSQDSAYFSQPSPPSPPSLSSPPSCSQPRVFNFDKDNEDLSPTENKPRSDSIQAAGSSRPNPARTQRGRGLGPARASGLKRKPGPNKPGLNKPGSTKAAPNDENSPGVQATISGLWRSFSFRDSPKLSRKEPLSPHKDNALAVS